MSSYTILVVDDTHFMRKMATDYLKQNEYEVVGEASNGKEAVKLYEELRPDIVMMDLTMPVMNGLEATKEILKLDPEAVVLVCSASNQQAMIFDALDIGAKGYLTKPFNPERMNEIIRKYAEPFLHPEAEAEANQELSEEQEIDMEAGDNGSEANDSEEAITVEISVEAQAPSEQAPSETVEDIGSSIDQEVESMEDANKINVGGNGLMRSFVTSYMCNWQEEINGEISNFAVTCTENENKIMIEMSDGDSEKQCIQFTLDGFNQLHSWIEGHLMTKMSKGDV